jgi:hypothetical protein
MFTPLSKAELASFPAGVPWIIVPFRDNAEQSRAAHLQAFVRHMKRYHPTWHVLIIEQSDDGRKFNRGALLNIGVRLAAKQGATYVILHDVDLLPLAPIVPYYEVIPLHPIHIGKAWVTKYDYPRFFGGVVSITVEDFVRANGFPNQFWGWGGEDDAFRDRLLAKEVPIAQPTLRTGFRELPHVHTASKQEWVNVTKHRDVRLDTGRMGVRTVRWTTDATQTLAPQIEQITVTLA